MNAITWFEIPVTDMDRAATFYNTILGIDIHRGEFGGDPHGFFPGDGVPGALVVREDLVPGTTGSLIYLNAGQQIEEIVARVAAAGGEVLQPVTPIPPQGVMAIFRDSEGNRVGLHQLPTK